MKNLRLISDTVTTTLPDPLRKKLSILYQKGKYKGLAELVRELIDEGATQRLKDAK